jgi:NAD(P)-dependent dehydrogenase (short-subunit alcohol dehydrogenase family)
MHPVTDRPIVITGASSGVGRELCARLAAQGHAVLGLARRPLALPGVESVAADLADPPAAAAALTAALAGRRPLALANNAAVFERCDAAVHDPAAAARLVTVNLLGTMAMTRVCLPPMLAAGGGRILFIASVAGLHGIPGQSAYCASKWGMLGYAEALGQEVQAQGVTVACLCPGGIDTPLWDTTPYPGDRSRLLPVAEVAEAAMFLLDRRPGTTCRRLVLFPENEWH